MTESAHRRNAVRIALWALVLVTLVGFVALNAWNIRIFNAVSVAQIIAFTTISAVAFLLFVALLFMLVRNLLKLYADQKSGVMGSRLRTRMLWGAVLVSLLPLTFMFAFSYLLMNRAVDRWFSQPVTTMRDDSNRMELELSQYADANARAEAESIASTLVTTAMLQHVLRAHQITLQGGFAVVFRDGKPVGAYHLPRQNGTAAGVKSFLPIPSSPVDEDAADSDTPSPDERFSPTDVSVLSAAQRADNPIYTVAGTDYALGTATVARRGSPGEIVVVGLPLPHDMSATMARLRTATDDYWILFRARRSVRTTYTVLLLMMTGLALFASTWLALHLSKQVTKPVEALADAMAAIAAGNYSHRVQESATEELGELVRSFNHMAQDLEGSRAQVEASTALLSTANSALEARRGELETMLETIPNGVATLDTGHRIVLANRALSEMLDPGGQQPFIGHAIAAVFPADLLESLDRLLLRSRRMGTASAELEMQSGGQTINVLATVAVLESSGISGSRKHLGYVLVLENATELLRAQKQSAWKEVARRVAHEIKNPLTPISLSAEQIGRHIERLDSTLVSAELVSPSIAIIRRCSQVISASVESMRGLVDQFASLAQFPTAQPRPADLNTIIENSLALFAGRTEGITLTRRLATGLPPVLVDPEAMKRALGNLIDNAVEAMHGCLLRDLRVSTTLLSNNTVELTVADTGMGLTDEMRERLFLPYFSTKQRGTGLGLAIAAKIIQEHGGTIRAEKNEPAGARFIVELKVAGPAETHWPPSQPRETLAEAAPEPAEVLL